MPENSQKQVRVMVPYGPVFGDVLFYDRVEAANFRDGVSMPTPGSAHPEGSRWPNHKLCGVTDDDDNGWLRFYYLKSLADQQSYNGEFGLSLSNDWPEVRQRWVVPRSGFVAGMRVAPTLTGYTWTFIGETVVRTGDPRTDAWFVATEHLWRDVTAVQQGAELDADTGEIRPVTRRMVLGTTGAAGVDEDGEYTEVTPINTVWGIATTRQAAGLAGAAVKTRVITGERVSYTWDPVLWVIHMTPLIRPGGTEIAEIVWEPEFLRDRYSGPCDAVTIEEWQAEPWEPIEEEPILPERIVFKGSLIGFIEIEPTLHREITVYEQAGDGHTEFAPFLHRRVYPATSLTDWPASVTVSCQVVPQAGGYLRRRQIVNRPPLTPVGNRVRLRVATAGSESVGLSWETTVTGTPSYRVDVSRDPRFESEFLAGFEDYDAGTATSVTVTGLVRGVVYFARVRIESPAVESNLVACITVPTPEIAVEQPSGTPKASGSTVAYGDVDVTAGLNKTFIIKNVGERALEGVVASLSGPQAGNWSITTPPASTVAAGGSTTMVVRSDPLEATPSMSCVLNIASNDADENPFTLTLTATGTGAPEIRVAGSTGDFVNGADTEDFGPVVSGQIEDRSLLVNNIGNTTLSSLAASLSGPDAALWSHAGLPTTLAGGASTGLALTFAPNSGVLGVKTCTLSIASNDANENPFTVTLIGEET